MKEENFKNFTEKNLGKEVIATIKVPFKRVIKGKLTKEMDTFYIKNGETTPIDSKMIKMMSVVLTKEERKRRNQEKRRKMVN
jgi:ribosome maturation protein Sdo1